MPPTKKGKGILSTFKALVVGRTQLPPSARKVVKKVGDVEISHITIARNPLSAATRFGMNAVSLGDFERKASKLPYDKLFHLYMIIALKNNQQVLLEKNEVIKIRLGQGTRQNAEVRLVPVNKTLTLAKLLENTKKYMGSKFLVYSPNNSNCQDFLLSILKANGLGNETHYKFIKQDTSSIFKNSPIFTKITNFVTDLGAKFNILKEGAGVKKKKSRPRKKSKKVLARKIKKLKKARKVKIIRGKIEAKQLEESLRPLIEAIKNIK